MDNTHRSSAPSVILEKVDFSYGATTILKDITVTFPAGKWTCLLGPSGCGKSTLLRMLSGSLRGSGTVRLENGSPLNRAVAWMAQDDLLLPWLPVLDNVCLGPMLRRELTVELRQKGLLLLQEAGLGERADALPAELSGGMRQRVALLRTLMEDRSVILMDEPFSRLDALTRLRLQDLAASMVPDATVVLVTHDPLEALRLGHHIHVMTGSPATLETPLIPPGTPPRDPADPELLRMQATLMAMLRQERVQ
jgi:putative hydroxymethylpyrimidine transport system ATP-binding protein